MAVHPRSRLVNPLLGTYFGIFAASLTAVVILLMIFEQLGVADGSLRLIMIFGALGLFAAIGASVATTLPSEFFLSGRRVPAFFNGLVLATAGLGGTGLVAFSGALFLAGSDMLCIALGIVAGFVAMVVLIAPFLRKFGAPTIPSYLGRRFESAPVRIIAASVSAVPLILFLVAELLVAHAAAVWLTQTSDQLAMAIVVGALVISLTPGGVRSLSWSGSAQSLTALFAVLVPATIVALLMTNLPLGQLSHGPVLRALGRAEALSVLSQPVAPPLAFDLPGQDLQAISGRFLTPYAGVGPLAFVLAVLSLLAGTAGSPSLLSRAVTTPTVYETRKSLGWAVLLIGVTIMTISSIAVFLREIVVNQLAGTLPTRLPDTLKTLIDFGLAGVDGRVSQLSPMSILFKRDGILIALPVLTEMPTALVHLVVAGTLAAALIGAGLSLCSLSTILAEDVIHGPRSELVSDGSRLLVGRIAILLVAIIAGWLASITTSDPLDLMLSALAISGSTLFPVILLSIWWKRTNAWGAIAGLLGGFTVAVLVFVIGSVTSGGPPPTFAPVIAVPIGVVIAIVVSHITPAPGRYTLEIVRDLRIPGGEPIYDREVRQSLQRQRQNA